MGLDDLEPGRLLKKSRIPKCFFRSESPDEADFAVFFPNGDIAIIWFGMLRDGMVLYEILRYVAKLSLSAGVRLGLVLGRVMSGNLGLRASGLSNLKCRL